MRNPRAFVILVSVLGLIATFARSWYTEMHREDGRKLVETWHGIRILAADRPFEDSGQTESIKGAAPTPAEVTTAVAALHRELSRYPSNFLASLGLRRIVLCRDLTHGPRRAGGLASHSAGTIYYSAGAIGRSTLWGRHAIHHEVMHLIDVLGATARNQQWTALNPGGFQYHALPPDSKPNSSAHLPRGFVSAYSMTNIREDRAEVFGYLMASPDYLAWRSLTDPVLNAKVSLVDEMIRGRGDLPKGWPDWPTLRDKWQKRMKTR